MGNKESTFKQNVNIQEKIKELYSVVLQYLIGEGHKIDKTISFKNGYYNYTTGKKDDRCKECIELQKNEDKHKRKKECQACKLMKEDEEYKRGENFRKEYADTLISKKTKTFTKYGRFDEYESKKEKAFQYQINKKEEFEIIEPTLEKQINTLISEIHSLNSRFKSVRKKLKSKKIVKSKKKIEKIKRFK